MVLYPWTSRILSGYLEFEKEAIGLSALLTTSPTQSYLLEGTTRLVLLNQRTPRSGFLFGAFNWMRPTISGFETLANSSFRSCPALRSSRRFLFRGKHESRFELAEGFTLSISGLKQSPVHLQVICSHQEQVCRLSLRNLLAIHTTNSLTSPMLPRDTGVYFFCEGSRSSSWLKRYLLQAEPHRLYVCTQANLKRRSHQVSYKDVILATSSILLLELHVIELGCPPDDPISTETIASMLLRFSRSGTILPLKIKILWKLLKTSLMYPTDFFPFLSRALMSKL